MTGLALIAGGLPQAAAAASEPAAVSEGADALAKKLFREQRYPEAALEFERLWAEQQTPKYLFNAAMAREMMGHELQAFVHLQVFIGLPGQPETEITRAKDRIEGVRERTVKLRVRVAPADLPAGTLELNARRAGAPAGPERPAEVHLNGATLAGLAVAGAPGAYDLPVELGRWELEFTSRGYGPGWISVDPTLGPASQSMVRLERLADVVDVTAEFTPGVALTAGIDVSLRGPAPAQATKQHVERTPVTWRLESGTWSLEAKAAGYEPVRRVFTVGVEPVRLKVQLARKRHDGRRLALGLGVASGVMAVTGAVMLGVTVSRWGAWRNALLVRTDALAREGSGGRTISGGNAAWNEASAGLTRNWRITNAGAGILGAGVGLGIGSVTGLAPRRRSLWIAEISVGTATGIGMFVAYQLGAVKPFFEYQSALGRHGDRENLDRFRTSGVAFGLLLGAGIGLVGGGVTGLLYERKLSPHTGRSRVVPYSDLHGAGLLLTRRF